MKLNKMTIIAALALGTMLAPCALIQAQDASTNTPAVTVRPPRARPLTLDQMVTKLGLTDDQKTNFLAVMTDMRKQMRDLRQDDSLSTEDRRAKMKSIHDDANTKLKTILTPDQFAQYQKLMPGRRPAKPAAAAAAAGN